MPILLVCNYKKISQFIQSVVILVPHRVYHLVTQSSWPQHHILVHLIFQKWMFSSTSSIERWSRHDNNNNKSKKEIRERCYWGLENSNIASWHKLDKLNPEYHNKNILVACLIRKNIKNPDDLVHQYYLSNNNKKKSHAQKEKKWKAQISWTGFTLWYGKDWLLWECTLHCLWHGNSRKENNNREFKIKTKIKRQKQCIYI